MILHPHRNAPRSVGNAATLMTHILYVIPTPLDDMLC